MKKKINSISNKFNMANWIGSQGHKIIEHIKDNKFICKNNFSVDGISFQKGDPILLTETVSVEFYQHNNKDYVYYNGQNISLYDFISLAKKDMQVYHILSLLKQKMNDEHYIDDLISFIQDVLSDSNSLFDIQIKNGVAEFNGNFINTNGKEVVTFDDNEIDKNI